MFKQLQFKSLLLLAVMLIGGASLSVSAVEKWVLTDPTDFSTGDIVVIVDQTSSCAMSNNKGTSAPLATSVTLNANKDEITSTVNDILQWVVTVTTSDSNVRSYQFGVSETDNYLYCTNTNNGVKVGSNTAKAFTWVADANNTNSTEPFLVNTATSRYIGVYYNNNTPQDWRCYTSINSNIKNTVTAFYKKTIVDDGKTDIATIGDDLTPTEVNVGDINDFSLNITPAANTTEGTDYIVVWESSDTDILDVEDGTYEAYAVGEVTVTVTVTPDDENTYNEVSRQFTVTVVDPNAPGTENNPYTVAQAIANTPSDGNVYIHGIVSSFYGSSTSIIDDTSHRYYISDDGSTTTQLLVYSGRGLDDEAFSNADDLLIGDEIVLYGKLIIYQNAPEVAKDNHIISLTRPEKDDPEFSFGETTAFTCDITQTFTAPALITAESFDGTVVYSSSETEVATVNASTGAVTLVAAGTTTITASSAATNNFLPGSASYTLTVTENAGVDPIRPASNSYYVKVTSTEEITDGQYLIVYGTDEVAFDGSLTTLDKGNNVITVEFDTDGTIKSTTDTRAAEFTINVTAGTVKSASGYYIGITSYGNGLKTTNDDDNPYTNSLAIDENEDLLITKTFDGGTMTLWFNANSGENNYRFRFYKTLGTTNKAIQLYKYVGGNASETETVTLSGYGYKTLVATENFTVSGATAYIVSAATSEGVTMTSVEVVPADEPIILKGEAYAEVTLTFTDDDASDVSANLLSVSEAGTNYDGNYVLAKKGENVGFYKWAGGSLGAGRVYLPASNVTTTSGAREYLPFSFSDATGISESSQFTVHSSQTVYNLNGQRVNTPNKGLYIMNGKKVIVK